MSDDILIRMRGEGESSSFIQGFNDLLRCCAVGELAVEIGAYAGQSTELIHDSRKFQRIISINPFIDGYDPSDIPITEFKLSDVRFRFYERILKYDNIFHLNLTSNEASKLFKDNSIDFLYIDGDHQYDCVKNDIITYLTKIKYNGIISGHDYTIFAGVKRAVDEVFGAPTKVFCDSSWMIQL